MSDVLQAIGAPAAIQAMERRRMAAKKIQVTKTTLVDTIVRLSIDELKHLVAREHGINPEATVEIFSDGEQVHGAFAFEFRETLEEKVK